MKQEILDKVTSVVDVNSRISKVFENVRQGTSLSSVLDDKAKQAAQSIIIHDEDDSSSSPEHTSSSKTFQHPKSLADVMSRKHHHKASPASIGDIKRSVDLLNTKVIAIEAQQATILASLRGLTLSLQRIEKALPQTTSEQSRSHVAFVDINSI